MQTGYAKRDVYLLAVCQALLATGNAVVITTSALAGQAMAPEGFATLPLFLQFVAIMATALPASFLMKRIGRRAGFAVGAGFALVSGLLGCGAILVGSFPLFCLASFGYGVFMGFGMYYRFAAADVAAPDFRPRAISYVLAGGVVAAITGPELAKATDDLFGPALFAGCFAAVAVLGLLTLLTLAFLRIPPPPAEERMGAGRPLAEIMRQPAFATALAAAAIAQGAMVLVMTATPLAMAFCGHGFDQTAFVIQWHVLGMFAPSFFTGHLISRFGVLNVMALRGGADPRLPGRGAHGHRNRAVLDRAVSARRRLELHVRRRHLASHHHLPAGREGQSAGDQRSDHLRDRCVRLAVFRAAAPSDRLAGGQSQHDPADPRRARRHPLAAPPADADRDLTPVLATRGLDRSAADHFRRRPLGHPAG